jgi:SAM-dependent methyltransferase
MTIGGPPEREPLDHRRGVAEAWDRFWVSKPFERSILAKLMRRGFIPAGSRAIADIAAATLRDVGGRRVLDAGCGTAVLSLELARRGAVVVLLVVSPTGVARARDLARALGREATVVEGSIFELPFRDGEFDLVWNTGVLEHFGLDDRRRALAEMIRTTRPGGAVLTVNPNPRSRVYRGMHAHAVRRGTWDVGYEDAFESLRDAVPEGVAVEEFSIGLLAQFHYVKYALPRPFRLPYLALHEGLQLALGRLNRHPGSLLVSRVSIPT